MKAVKLYAWDREKQKLYPTKGKLPIPEGATEADLTKAIAKAVEVKNALRSEHGEWQMVIVQDGIIVGVEGPMKGEIVWIS
jgi:hypothetical protein